MNKHRFHCGNNSHRSVFIKLLMVIAATMFLMQLILGSLFGILFGKHSMNPLESNLQRYARYLVENIGSPPDTTLARQLADSLHIDIQIENAALSWTTNPLLLAESRPGNRHHQKPFKKSIFHKPVQIRSEDGTLFSIHWNFGTMAALHKELFVVMAGLVILIFALSHLFIRKILKPIRWLRQGVDDVAQGNLNVKIPVLKNDELGCLSESFNDMIRQLRNMLKARDQLLLDVSHELRSPITRMKVALEFLPHHQKKAAILADLQEIEAMITEILESERLNNNQIKRQRTDLKQLLNSVAHEFDHRLPGYELKTETIYNRVDGERMKIVFRNILENAFKYSEQNSKPIKIILKKPCTFAFIDDGPGIPEDNLTNLFEPFYRVDQSRTRETGGYGLGLHLCKKIIEAHGGIIHIANNETRGITVTIDLPETQ